MRNAGRTRRLQLPARGDDTGSALGAMMFAVTIAAILSLAALASIQVSRSSSTVEHSGVALLAVGNRIQVALDDINAHRDIASVPARVNTAKQCDADNVCTELTATPGAAGQMYILATATTPNGTTASRQAILRQLRTSGIVTGVEADGRLKFVQDGGTGTDLWELVAQDGS
jgi:Tfp pilus assembly protein PilE